MIRTEGKSYEIEGDNIAYTMAGREISPPLIMLHGWMSHRGVWQHSMEILQHSHRCIAVDLLGFGVSDKPKDGDYSIPAQGKRILEIADYLDCKHFQLIGHSMGGQIALYLASTLAPERVDKIVSVAGIVSGNMKPAITRIVARMVAAGKQSPGLYNRARSMIRRSWFANLLFRPWFYKMNAIPFPVWEMDRQMATRRDIYNSAYQSYQAIRQLDLARDIRDIRAPTLAIFGKQDRVTPLSEGQLIKERVPEGQMAVIDRCGHFPMYEQREKYLQLLHAFLHN